MADLHANARGRPKKYGRAARPVTVTLPVDVLARLTAIDHDLGQAIVRLVETGARARHAAMQTAELAQYGNHAVIVVTPIKALKRLRGVQRVPLGNGGALVSLDAPHTVPALGLALRDATERDDIDQDEREALKA